MVQPATVASRIETGVKARKTARLAGLRIEALRCCATSRPVSQQADDAKEAAENARHPRIEHRIPERWPHLHHVGTEAARVRNNSSDQDRSDRGRATRRVVELVFDDSPVGKHGYRSIPTQAEVLGDHQSICALAVHESHEVCRPQIPTCVSTLQSNGCLHGRRMHAPVYEDSHETLRSTVSGRERLASFDGLVIDEFYR
jgi:hypothetical protein